MHKQNIDVEKQSLMGAGTSTNTGLGDNKTSQQLADQFKLTTDALKMRMKKKSRVTKCALCITVLLIMLRIGYYVSVITAGYVLQTVEHCNSGFPSVSTILLLQSNFMIFYMIDENFLFFLLRSICSEGYGSRGKLSRLGSGIKSLSIMINNVSKIVIGVFGLYVVVHFNRDCIATDNVLIYVIVISVMFLCSAMLTVERLAYSLLRSGGTESSDD